MSIGVRILPSTKKQIDTLSKLQRCSASQVVAELIKKAPPLPKADPGRRVAVSYHLDAAICERLEQLAAESNRSQSDVIEYLARGSGVN